MNLRPMRFKNYTWPHNPRVYGIEYRRELVSHRTPGGLYTLENMGRGHRVLRGEGEFAGAGAYDEFRRLATVFYDPSPGTLVHPVWQETSAYFVSLSLSQEPQENYVAYSFEFWECYDGYSRKLKAVGSSAESGAGVSAEKYHTVASGETLWGIARKYDLSITEIVGMNPQIKNPNVIYVGNKIRVG